MIGLNAERIERRVHLVGDLHETAVEHRERDGIERRHRRSPVVLPVGAAAASYRFAERDHLRRADQLVEPANRACARGMARSCRARRASRSSRCAMRRARARSRREKSPARSRAPRARRRARAASCRPRPCWPSAARPRRAPRAMRASSSRVFGASTNSMSAPASR